MEDREVSSSICGLDWFCRQWSKVEMHDRSSASSGRKPHSRREQGWSWQNGVALATQ